MTTIIATGPKKSGCSLLIRLFDSHPQVSTLIDESFFWEHVYNYLDNQQLFVDLFHAYSVEELIQGMHARAVISCLDGVYRQYTPEEFSVGFYWLEHHWVHQLSKLHDCHNVTSIWNCLMTAYKLARGESHKPNTFISCGDFGKSLIATRRTLKDYEEIYYIRNPN